MKNIKKILVLSILLIAIGGCSIVGGKEKRQIEKTLKDRHGISFVVTKMWGNQSGSKYYVAKVKDTPEHVIEGMIPAGTNDITDNYVDTIMSIEIGNYMTEQLDKVIPGIVVLVQPTAPRYANPKGNSSSIDLDEWVKSNYENALVNDGSAMGMNSILLIPLEEIDNIDFETYKKTVMEMFDTKLYGFSLFVQRETMIYVDQSRLEEMLSFSSFGTYDSGGMVMVVKEQGELVPREVSRRINKTLGFKYSATDKLRVGKYEFAAEQKGVFE